jgi:predicted acetyltransferase
VRIEKASKAQKPLIERLMQLYLYDFSEIEGGDVGQDGLFEHPRLLLESYWSDPSRHPFLVHAAENIAGFALVNTYTCLEENRDARSIAEFFVLRKYRRKGIGRKAAFAVFEAFPGKWEIRQTRGNVVGQRFWRNILGEYTGGRFSETVLDNDIWHGPIQSFDNSDRARVIGNRRIE